MTGGGKHVNGFSHFSKNQIVNILSIIYWYLVIGYSMNVLQYCFEFIIHYVYQLFKKSWLQIQFLNFEKYFRIHSNLVLPLKSWWINIPTENITIMDAFGIFQWFEGQCNLHAIALSSKLQEPERYTFLKFFWSDEIVNMKVCIHTYYVRYERQWWFLIYWRYDHTSL